ncbi:hypothetical protein H6P81_000672 [Aristolochia fimbriata]|uniref:Uncharacterized protein n=1 Tax=Aristolochia fimbriata TaxID=158543 RepID=A0AAV7F5K5_ARIFI|nr:hypothetical protein H6P81_000672 [Aristolochia fimbriata]
MGAKGADDHHSQSSDLVFFDKGTESFTLFYPGPENRLEGSEASLKELGLQALEEARATRSGSLLGVFEKGAESEEEEEEEEEDNGGDSEEEENGGVDEEDPVTAFGDEKVNEKLRLLAALAGVDGGNGQPADVLLANVIMVLKELEERSCGCGGFPMEDDDEQFESFMG